MQLGFPLPPPVGAQAARHDHADYANQREPEAKASYSSSISHSLLNATCGSTLVARLAGSQHANKAIAAKINVTAPNVSGSVALTPNNSLDSSRVNAKEAAR